MKRVASPGLMHDTGCLGLVNWDDPEGWHLLQIILFIYLFLVVLGLCWHMGFSVVAVSGDYSLVAVTWASHCGGFSCRWSTGSRAHGFQSLRQVGSAVAAPGLQSADSVVEVHGLSCSAACGIFLHQGLNLCLLHWQVDSLPLSYQGGPGIFICPFFY